MPKKIVTLRDIRQEYLDRRDRVLQDQERERGDGGPIYCPRSGALISREERCPMTGAVTYHTYPDDE